MLNRRILLTRAAAILGTTISPSVARSVLAAGPANEACPPVLSRSEFQLVEVMTDRIIPDTDIPGAVAAGVPNFIDHMVRASLTDAEASLIHDGLRQFDADAQEQHGQSFVALELDQQIQLLRDLDKKMIFPFYPPGRALPFFALFKELTVVGYFTSEVGATVALNYLPVPGRYDGCVEFELDGKAWFRQGFG